MSEFVANDLARRGFEARAKRQSGKSVRALERCFKEELEVINDPARRVIVLTPRGGAKTHTARHLILQTMLDIPYARVLYIAITRKMAKELLFDELARDNHELELGWTPSILDLTYRGTNGSKCLMFGAKDEKDVERQRGQPWDLVVIDEAQGIGAKVLKRLLYDVVLPRLGDRNGRLVLCGTPGYILTGEFFDASGPTSANIFIDKQGKRRAVSRPWDERNDLKWQHVRWNWSYHWWPLSANISEGGQGLLKAAIELKEASGWDDDHPTWRREYLGQWIPDDANLAYKFNVEKNVWYPEHGTDLAGALKSLPSGHDWHYVMGIDPGHTDPFAIEVFAYAETYDKILQVYEHEVEKDPDGRKSFEMAATKVLEIMERLDVEQIVCDQTGGIGNILIDSLVKDYGIPVKPAVKTHKRDAVELMNSDMIGGKIKMMPGTKIIEEMTYLSWDDTGHKTRSGQADHHCDAAVYIFREIYGVGTEVPKVIIPKQSSEWIDRRMQEAEERLEYTESRRQSGDEDFEDDEKLWNDHNDQWS